MAKKKSSKGPKESAEGKLPVGKLALTKDPRVYAERLPFVQQQHKRVLGLDLASSCGVTFCDIMPGQPVKAAPLVGGQWDLSVTNHDTNSIRYVRLKTFLAAVAPDLVFYEEVKFVGSAAVPGMKQNLTALVARAVSGAQVVHGLQAILTTWCEEHDVPCEAVPIGTLKKYATGKGNANKVEMIEACNTKFETEFDPETYEQTGCDNIADSMFLCALAVQNYSEGLG